MPHVIGAGVGPGVGVGVGEGIDVGEGVGDATGVGLGVGVGEGLDVGLGDAVTWGDCEDVGVGVGEGCKGDDTDGVGVAVGEMEVVGCFNRAMVKMPTAVITMSKTARRATLELDRCGVASSSMIVMSTCNASVCLPYNKTYYIILISNH